VAENAAQELSVNVKLAASAGAMGSAQAAETAAASAMLVRRFVFMRYLEERRNRDPAIVVRP
jgi:hypothetical protein